jgi:hypothetical protein
METPKPPPDGNTDTEASVDNFLEEECSICFEPYSDTNPPYTIPSCRHVFHSRCLNNWVYSDRSQQTTCPLCRRNIVFDYSNYTPSLIEGEEILAETFATMSMAGLSLYLSNDGSVDLQGAHHTATGLLSLNPSSQHLQQAHINSAAVSAAAILQRAHALRAENAPQPFRSQELNPFSRPPNFFPPPLSIPPDTFVRYDRPFYINARYPRDIVNVFTPLSHHLGGSTLTLPPVHDAYDNPAAHHNDRRVRNHHGPLSIRSNGRNIPQSPTQVSSPVRNNNYPIMGSPPWNGYPAYDGANTYGNTYGQYPNERSNGSLLARPDEAGRSNAVPLPNGGQIRNQAPLVGRQRRWASFVPGAIQHGSALQGEVDMDRPVQDGRSRGNRDTENGDENDNDNGERRRMAERGSGHGPASARSPEPVSDSDSEADVQSGNESK